MKINPYVRPDADKLKQSFNETFTKFVTMLTKYPKFIFTLLKLRSYAKRQGITYDQALDEAILALPKLDFEIPEAYDDLTGWVQLCALAGVPAVPVFAGPKVKLEILIETTSNVEKATLKGEELPKPHPSIDAAAQWCEDEFQNHKRMWRWECCGPETLKLVAGVRKVTATVEMGDASPNIGVPNTVPHIPFMTDHRLFNICWGQRRIEIGLVSRPWVKPLIYNGFPVEFRVLKLKDGYAACNYYPQRALAKQHLALMEKAVELTKKLAACKPTEDSGLVPLSEQFSCDWLVDENGEVIFLEGGPGCTSKGGCHPCCFGLPIRGKGPKAGARLLESEPDAEFFIDPRRQKIIDKYMKGETEFMQTAKNAQLDPRQLAIILAVQGFIPREAFAKVISNIKH